MVIELTFENNSRCLRKMKIHVKQNILTELIRDNETLIKLIRKERKSDEVLINIRDLDI